LSRCETSTEPRQVKQPDFPQLPSVVTPRSPLRETRFSFVQPCVATFFLRAAGCIRSYYTRRRTHNINGCGGGISPGAREGDTVQRYIQQGRAGYNRGARGVEQGQSW
ncbi:unnamed protein product, partial [Laminaria digitata]